MERLQEAVARIRERISSWLAKKVRVSEDDTKASLVEPLLAASGWDVHDPSEVRRQYRHRSGDNPVDYALLLDGKPVLLIEAKPLGEALEDRKWQVQAVNYANTSGVDWCALTDGNLWRIYKSNAPGEVEKKLFLESQLLSSGDDRPTRQPTEVLSLLSKEAISKGKLDILWRTQNVYKRTEQALQELIEGKDRTLVTLLRKKTCLDRREVLAGIEHIRLSEVMPSVGIAQPLARPVASAEKSSRRRGRPTTVPGLPSRSQMELPLLQAILRRGGQVLRKTDLEAIAEELADEFHLTSEQRNAKLKNTGTRVLHYRLGWTRWRLVISGDIDGGTTRGVWKITEKGRRRAQSGA